MRRLECDHNSIVREPHVNTVIEMINEVRHGDAVSESTTSV
jgi:thioesterase domain-containing protein